MRRSWMTLRIAHFVAVAYLLVKTEQAGQVRFAAKNPFAHVAVVIAPRGRARERVAQN
jgi:hypothetical protein